MEGTRSAFSNQPHTPHWEPPEALAATARLRAARRPGSSVAPSELSKLAHAGSVQNRATDVYKFALMVVRILDHGRGRAVNRDPGAAAAILLDTAGRAAATVLLRSLDADPLRRPPIREWYDALRGGAQGPAPRTPAPPPPARQVPPQRVGSWENVEGTGWVRRRPGP
jgi:hypothetical protein